jgi:hypothetical protein
VELFLSESARSCLLAQPTNRRVKFCLWMDAGAAIEPIAQFALPDGFALKLMINPPPSRSRSRLYLPRQGVGDLGR